MAASLLRVDVDGEGDLRGTRGRRRRRSTAPADRGDRRRSRGVALTTSWKRSRPRRRNSGAGPSTSAPATSTRVGDPLGRRSRRRGRPRPSRRRGSGRRTAGSAAPRGARAPRRGSRRRRGAPRASDRRRVGRGGLDDHAPAARPAPGAAGELGDERERALLGAEVGEAQRLVGVEDDAERRRRGSRGPWRPSGCRRAAPRARRRSARAARDRVLGRAGVGVEAEDRDAERLGELGLEPLGARAVARDRERAAGVAALRARARGGRSGGRRSRPAARCRTSATSQFGHFQTLPQSRQVRKFDQPRRLSSTIALRAVAAARAACRGAAGGASPRMSSTSTGGSGRPSTRSGSVRRGSSRQVSGRGVARARTAAPRRCSRARSAATQPRVVARVALVLVGGVVLLVDDDQAEVARPARRPRERGPTATRASPRAQPQPLVVALALAERGVQQRDGVAEARREARDGLRRQRDLRHEHDHARARARARARPRAGRPRSCPTR